MFKITSAQSYSLLKKQNIIDIVYKTTIVPDSFKKELRRVVELYNVKYGLTYNTLYISSESIPNNVYPDGSIVTTQAHALYQKIILNEFEIKNWNMKKFRNMIKHELFHTLAKDTIRIKPFLLEVRDSVIGFIGLSMNVKLGSGEVSGLKKLEEAAAEVCAIRTGEGYSQDASYFGITEIFTYLIELKYITALDLVLYQSRSDMNGLVKKILNRKEEPTIRELMIVYNVFNNLWEVEDPCKINKWILYICLARSKSQIAGY